MFTFTKPLPWACSSAAGNVVAVPVSSALTWSGVIDGRCWSSSATAPDTTAAACDVPLPRKTGRSNAAVAAVLGVDVGARVHAGRCNDLPGATTSGLRTPSPSGARRRRWCRRPIDGVPALSAAPTESTNGSCAGCQRACRCPCRRCRRRPRPRSPCATPPRRRRTAGRAGSSAATWVPNDRFSTRMFMPGSLRCCDDPVDRRDHLGHVGVAVGVGDLEADHPGVRRDAVVGVGQRCPVVSVPSLPAMMPAMCVP